jgi:pimeloyl-ACP methyl ester carboxylesterase
MFARQADRDAPTTWPTRLAQYDVVCAWGIYSCLQRLEAIRVPVLVADGDSDPMVLPRYSYLLAGLIPHASLKIYPDAAHGFLLQRTTWSSPLMSAAFTVTEEPSFGTLRTNDNAAWVDRPQRQVV